MELEEGVCVRRHTYLLDSWFAHEFDVSEQIESYARDWIGPLRSNRQVTYTGEELRVNALTERNIDNGIYYVWIRKLSVS